MIPRFYHWVLLALFSVVLLVPAAWGVGLWLYESGGPDLGTAGAGRAALAGDASTAGTNPAGMTRLDRSQMLAAVRGLYINFQCDTQSSGPTDEENRTPNLPLDRQIRIGTGVQYVRNKDVTVGVAYEYLDAGDGDIDQEGGPLQGPLMGDYDPNAIHFFAVNLIWKF